MRTTPAQYFQGYGTPQLQETPQLQAVSRVQTTTLEVDHTLSFIIIGIVAGAALGLAIAALIKK